jgi:predicted aspartyl protease
MATRTIQVVFGVVLAAGLIVASVPASAGECELHQYFDMPVTMQGSRAVVPARVNGIDVRFEIDTGAHYSTVWREDAQRLGLSSVDTHDLAGGSHSDFVVVGIAGQSVADIGEAKDFVLANRLPMKHVQFEIVGRPSAEGSVGLIGQNLLMFADVEYDFAHGLMQFFKPRDCAGVNLAYWVNGAGDVIALDVTSTAFRIAGAAKVNGHAIRVGFDTGSPTSLLSRAAAERAGVKLSDADFVGSTSGIGPGELKVWRAPVASFAIGGEEIRNTRIRLADLGRDTDMILGMDFFLSHRILVSRTQNRIYFTYNGGPVFRLDDAEREKPVQ